jgi:hypothetical protein
MADDLEPIRQEFIADLSDYIEPIEDASDETEGFADVVKQAGENLRGLRDSASEVGGSLGELGGAAGDADTSLTGMAASEDDATASTEALSESVGSLRDKVYEMYPGIDEATAALLAEAGAADDATLSNEGYAASLAAVSAQGDGLHATLAQLKNLLGAAELGESFTVAQYSAGRFFIDTEEGAEGAKTAITGLRTDASLLDDAMLKSANSTRDFWEAVNALNPELGFSGHIFKDARSALRDLGATEQEAAAGATALAKAQSELDNVAGAGGGGLSGLIAKMFGGGSGDVGGEDSFLPPGYLSSIWGVTKLAGLGTAVVALSTEAGALVTGLSAAVMGIVPAVVLALPSLDALKNSYSSIATARANWTQAEQTAQRDPTKDNLAAEATAAAQLKAAYADVPSYLRPVMSDISVLSREYKSMAKAFEPEVFGVFNRGLRIAEELLPTFKPLADQAVKGIDPLLDRLEKFFHEPWDTLHTPTGALAEHNPLQDALAPPTGWEKWLKQIQPDIAPAEKAIGQFIGTVVGDWGKFMTKFSPKDIQNAFHVLDVAVNLWEQTWVLVIGEAMNFWDENVAVFNTGARLVKDSLHDIEDAADVARETVIHVGHDIEHDWDTTWSHIVSYAHGVPHKIVAALGDMGSLLVNAGDALMHGFLHGIESGFDDVKNFVSGVGGWIASHKGPVEADAQLLRPHGEAIMHGLVTGLRDGMPELMQQLGLTTGVLKGLGGAGLGGSSSTTPVIHVTTPITLTPGTQGYNDPAFLHMLNQAVQECVLRYQTLNPGNGLNRIVPGIRT